MNDKMRGALQMTAAMTIAGTIGWFVIVSGEPVIDVVFWRCAIGAVGSRLPRSRSADCCGAISSCSTPSVCASNACSR